MVMHLIILRLVAEGNRRKVVFQDGGYFLGFLKRKRS